MRILILTHAQYITIALPKIIEFANELSKNGNDITILATSRKNIIQSEEFSKDNVKYLLSPSILAGRFRHGADFYDVVRRILLIRKKKYDIVHAIDSRPTVILPAMYLKIRKKIPLVLEWSDLFGEGGTISERSGKIYRNTIGILEAYFEKRFRLFANGAVVVTNMLKNRLVVLGFEEKKIHIHRMGCNTKNFKMQNINSARQRLNIPSKEIIFSYFGRIHQNDHSFLLDSFRKFKDIHVSNKIKLLFIGSTTPLKHPVPWDINYIGKVTNKNYIEYIIATDICLLPLKITKSNLARWPSKFADYLAAGKPVVATPVSEFAEIFKKSNIGVLTKSDHSQEFSNALCEVYENMDQWEIMGKNSRNYAVNNLDWNIIVKKIMKFYNKICETN